MGIEKEKIGIIGGGLMGAGIAQIFASHGHNVKIFEPFDANRDTIFDRITDNLKTMGHSHAKIKDCLSHITLTETQSKAVYDADFVTEAAPEKLELKRKIFSNLVTQAPSHCILASNTSVMPITGISEGIDSNDRIVGTHWWNPPFLIPLVEVVQAKATSDATVDSTLDILTRIGKVPAHCKKDSPGFIANRLQHALWREAIAMVAEGICDAQTLDTCVKNSFGLRLPQLGPLENADLVGLPLTLDIHKTMIPQLNQHDRPHEFLEAKIAQGHLGFATQKGFRDWTAAEMDSVRHDLLHYLMRMQTQNAHT